MNDSIARRQRRRRERRGQERIILTTATASHDTPRQHNHLRRHNRGLREEEERHSQPTGGGRYEEGCDEEVEVESSGWRCHVSSIATISEGRHVAVVGINLDEYDDDVDGDYASRIVEEIRTGLIVDDGVVLVEEVRAY